VVGLRAVSLVVALAALPVRAKGPAGPAQPIRFSHKVHATGPRSA
jgi:hypothetical protein